MHVARRLAPAVMVVASIASCGADEHVPQVTDAWLVPDAWEEPPPPPPPESDYEDAYRAIEVLVDLEARLPSLLVDGQLPVGVEAATPSATCCAAGGVTACEPNPAFWDDGLWLALGVRLERPHKFVLSAHGVDGRSLMLWVVLDLDCDGTVSSIVMDCTLTNGVVSCGLTLPALVD